MTKAAKIEHTLGVVPVDGRQEAEELCEWGSPVGPLQVVAGAVRRTVDEGAAGASLWVTGLIGTAESVSLSRVCSLQPLNRLFFV